MSVAGASLRPLGELQGPSRFFLFTAGKRLADRLFEQGIQHPRMFKLHMGPQTAVIATHPEIARDIIMRPADFPKLSMPYAIRDRLNQDSNGEDFNIVMANGERWRSLSQPLAPAFKKPALAPLAPLFSEISQRLVDKWLAAGDTVVDAKADMSAFALDVLGDAVMGTDFNALSGEFAHTYEQYQLIMYEQANPLYMAFPWLERFTFLPRNRKFNAAIDHMRGVLQDAVDARLAQRQAQIERGEADGPPRDMLDMVLGGGLGEDGVVKPHQVAPLFWIFFVAGHDTTAISLTWMCHYLAHNPEVQQKARAEAQVAMARAGGAELTAEAMDEVQYISALIKENLRLRPPVYNLMTRHAVRETHLDGFSIPKGTMVSIHIGAVNRHPDVHEKPHEFNPERFMDGRLRTFQNMPFSAGPRRCLGDKFSILEQKVLLVKLLSAMEILPVGGTDVALAGDSIPVVFGQPESMSVRVRPCDP